MSMIIMMNMLIITIMIDYKHDSDDEYGNNHDNDRVWSWW